MATVLRELPGGARQWSVPVRVTREQSAERAFAPVYGSGSSRYRGSCLPFGVHGRAAAIGGNESAAEVSGVNVKKTKIIIYVTATALYALAGFLLWNLHPAKVFMGDTGSLFIGGVLCALAFGINQPLLLIPAGIVYILETLSDILQVGYFKLTHGKRLFKMAPLHHHFEMSGWSENKIVVVFSLLALAGCLAAGLLL